MSTGKLTYRQILELAGLYHCMVFGGWHTETFVSYNYGERELVGEWHECSEWTRDEWRATFERVSNTKSAELWQKARGANNAKLDIS